MKLGRNSKCPCGSGTKVKKCHPELVNHEERDGRWFLDMQGFFESCTDYVAPESETDATLYKEMGCPLGYCPHETDNGEPCAAPNCGV